MTDVSEKHIETHLRKEVKKLHGLCLKFTSPGFDGVPDRLILLPTGRIYFVELKSPKGRLSPIQKIIHQMFKILGFPVTVIRSIEEANDFINIIS